MIPNKNSSSSNNDEKKKKKKKKAVETRIYDLCINVSTFVIYIVYTSLCFIWLLIHFLYVFYLYILVCLFAFLLACLSVCLLILLSRTQPTVIFKICMGLLGDSSKTKRNNIKVRDYQTFQSSARTHLMKALDDILSPQIISDCDRPKKPPKLTSLASNSVVSSMQKSMQISMGSQASSCPHGHEKKTFRLFIGSETTNTIWQTNMAIENCLL